MTCKRHKAAATHIENGLGYCSRCFIEALKFADAVETERIIQRVRARIREMR